MTAVEQLLCQEGMALMKRGNDPLHGIDHVQRMLASLDAFLRRHTVNESTLSVLRFAICWHDTWKASRLTRHPLGLLWHQIWEGHGSAALFARAARGRIPEPLIREVAYAIRKHSALQLLPRRTLAAKLLWDLDCLEELHPIRRQQTAEVFHQDAPWISRAGARWYLRFAQQRAPARFHFLWFRLQAIRLTLPQ